MKQISVNLDDETVEQMKELAELWGLPDVRHNSAVIARCVERVWMVERERGDYADKADDSPGTIDNAR